MVVLVLFGLGTTASHAVKLEPKDFAKSKTHFELDRYLQGHCVSWGVFENTDGSPRRTFTCDNQGVRNRAGDLVLTQHFQFSDGEKLVRSWNIHRVDSTHWAATANDLIGVAKGEGQGNALYWEYTITLNAKNPLATVHVRQWMFQPEGTNELMTRLVVTKLGVPVLEVSEVIHHVVNN